MIQTPRAAVLVALLIMSLPVYGYTDPGSGALLVQLLLASIAGAVFYFRQTLAFLARRLWRKPSAGKSATNETPK